MRAVTCRHYEARQLGEVRDLLISIYAEVYADRLADPFFTVEHFAERLATQTAAANWEAVVGFDGDEPVGYAYGATRSANSRAWEGVSPPPDPELARETGSRTFFLFELMMRTPWRKIGTAKLVHDELIRRRPEERVSLTVERDHPRVRALYESWGYWHVGSTQPFPDAPLFDLMIRPIRGPANGTAGLA